MLYAEMTRTELLDCFPKNGNICEVGVFGCDFSRKILSIINPKELHLIDIWKWKYFDWDSPSEENKHKKEHFIKWATLHFPDYQGDHPDTLLENFFQIALNIQKEAKNTIIKVHRGESLVMGSLLPDKYFDAIYLDADHHYDSVLNDLFLFQKKIKPGGIIFGDDFIDDLSRSDGLYGTIDAVNTFVKRTKMKPLLVTGFGESQFVLYEEYSNYVKSLLQQVLNKGKNLIELNDNCLSRFSNKTVQIGVFKKDIPSFI